MKTNKEIITAIANSTKDEALKHLLTKTNDIETLADTILSNDYQVQKNAFLSTLINTIAFRIVSKKIIKNKLSELKKGKLPFGTTFQHIVANPQKGTPYALNSSDLLKVCIPDTKSVYFQLNRADKYQVTISDPMLRRSLLQEGGLSDLVQMCVSSLYSGDNLDEQNLTKQLISNAYLNDKVKKVVLLYRGKTYTDFNPANTLKEIEYFEDKDLCEEILATMNEYSNNFTFGSSKYNTYSDTTATEEKYQKFITTTDLSDQIILMRTDLLAKIDVKVLAKTFNLSKAELKQRIIPVDDFNGTQIKAMLCDSAWFQIRDVLYKMTDFVNGSNLTQQYFLHHHEILGYDILANAVVFVDSSDEKFKTA